MNYKHRIRLTGLAVQDGQVLMVKHVDPKTLSERWAIPGGGLENSDPDIMQGVAREMLEETGLSVQAGNIQFTSEYVDHRNQVLMLHVWIRCYPTNGPRFGETHMENLVEGDNIVDLGWWSRDSFLAAKHRADVPLRNPDFWDNLDNVSGPPVHLGRWED